MSDSTQSLDERLRDWAAPSRPDEAWETQVAAIQARLATEAGALDGALLEPPRFEAEDEARATASDLSPKTKKRGDASMSDVPEKPKGPEKRVSLAEMAQQLKARTSQPPVSERGDGGRTSVPPGGRVSVPPPSRVSVPPPSRTSVPPVSTPSDPGRTSGTGDSGIIDLKAAAAASDPNAPQIAPGSTSIFDDDQAKVAAATPAAKGPAKPAAKSSGAIVGIGLAAVGIAAALAVVVMNGKSAQEPPAAVAVAEAQKPVAPPQSTQAIAPTTLPGAAPSASVAAASPGDLPSADQPKAVAAAGPLVPAPAKAEPSAKPPEPAATAAASAVAAAAAPPAGSNAGDLKTAMKTAAGATEAKGDQPAPTPASGPDQGSIPEQPSQGAIQSAIGAHMGAAKACVKELEAVSHVNLTFGSDGKVKSVNVTGAAASAGADGCIKAAFAKAGVGPFSRSSYSVGFTVRP